MSTLSRTVIGLSTILDRIASVLAGAAIVVLVGAVMLQVIARYVFSQPPAYTEELARYAMIWAGLIGASMSFKRRFDPALFNGITKGPVWLRAGAELVKSLVVLIYLLPILWHVFFGPGMNPARGFLLRHSRTMADALPFSTVWVAIAVPLMIVLVLIHLVARWFGDAGPAEPDRDAT
ncbi:C4-dicarboxylate ABC transporter permease [Oceanicola sp. 22II-s10i]|uniref:TRAP transporter small permease n=1 Tax=Oceanicola sp. 22II-s10i TaxID=1317116 RepID=UPI000B526C19|nr:TRAP transporter small permease subunit [Oceanicola sp. 22II-s10i]OWU85943.1 C4-dicarboxylate ABC transporter permease [Oceanicola sp. 22II-s10i]